ncbi:Uma2 family endonuclease [Vacuolonema iberomarrocanum]|uniref:Uma2 family endonuclease n=1 Tax=Vacuolonema iberomarrocanum TaxID=3454632 RepID=UPI0019E4D5A4|nr:Uma2 family endonuclease [filamentous cyanobacterium LEGE 07170]
MTTTTQKITFAEYLTYDDGTDTRYELVEGELVPMSLGTGRHGAIIRFLVQQFEAALPELGQDWVALPALVGVRSPRGGRWDTSRIPDVTVMARAQWEDMADRPAVIDFNEPPPVLIAEVVSPSTKTEDYRTKRSEYATLDIPEYWIIDPIAQTLTLCVLDHGFYDAIELQGEDVVRSPLFPNLSLTAAQILTGR